MIKGMDGLRGLTRVEGREIAYLKKLRGCGALIDVDFQALIEKIFEQCRQLIAPGDLGLAVRRNEIQSLKGASVLHALIRSSLTLSGLSLRYGGSPIHIDEHQLFTNISFDHFTFDHFNSHDAQTPYKQFRFTLHCRAHPSYVQISTFGPYCFLVTTSGAILNHRQSVFRSHRQPILPVWRSNHRLPFRLILGDLRAESKVRQFYEKAHPSAKLTRATRSEYALTLPSLPKRMLSLLMSR